MRTVCFFLIVVFPIWAQADDMPRFQHDVLPLLKSRCAKCHGDKVQKSELNLLKLAGIRKGGESGELVVPGKPEESLLYEMIHDGSMPPNGEGHFRRTKLR